LVGDECGTVEFFSKLMELAQESSKLLLAFRELSSPHKVLQGARFREVLNT